MVPSVDPGWSSWAVFVLLLGSSSVVLCVEWNKSCDGGLRTWLLTAVCVTGICGILGGMFYGRGDGTRSTRFLDNGDDDDIDDDGSTVAGMDLGPMDLPPSTKGPAHLPSLPEEGGGDSMNGDVEADAGRQRSMDDDGITSAHGSSVSVQLASRASSSLQNQYFGPGPKVFPDAIFFILVLSQWFLAGWSIVGAALYFRLFEGSKSCSPLLRHWTLLVVIIGFLSCLLAVCYSGIMCCMLGSSFRSRRPKASSDTRSFQGEMTARNDVSKGSHGGMM